MRNLNYVLSFHDENISQIVKFFNMYYKFSNKVKNYVVSNIRRYETNPVHRYKDLKSFLKFVVGYVAI